MQPLAIPRLPLEEIATDLVVALPRTSEGWAAILSVVCRLTRTADVVPTAQAVTARGTALLLLREVIRLHGVPVAIVSDRDTRLTRGNACVES